MRSIETALKALEKRARKCDTVAQGDYCRKHLPPPRIMLDDVEKADGIDRDYCPICRKPYPPNIPRVTICFEDTHPEPPRP